MPALDFDTQYFYNPIVGYEIDPRSRIVDHNGYDVYGPQFIKMITWYV